MKIASTEIADVKTVSQRFDLHVFETLKLFSIILNYSPSITLLRHSQAAISAN